MLPLRRRIEDTKMNTTHTATTTITLDQTMVFIGTEGSDVVADPGDYSLEAAQEWLQLIPRTERRDELLRDFL